MTSEVGSGQVAIFPTFRGFRSKTNAEMSGAGREGGRSFNSAFNVGAGDPGQALIKKLNAQIASGSKALSSARLAEQDAAGKVRVAEAALAEARAKGGETSSRAIAAEERLAAAQRKLVDAQTKTKQSTDQLKDAQAKLADVTSDAGSSGEQSANRFTRGWQSLKQRLSSTVRSSVDDAGNAAKSSAEDAGKKSGGAFSAGFKGAMGALAGVFAFDTVKDFFSGAVKGAGDLEQSAGAIQSVFKGSASEMLKWSTEAQNSVGLTQNEFNELGTLIGAQLKNGGTAMDELAPKTNQLIGLGADLSSMFGGTSREAIEALSSALKGERDPIERYGVSLNQAKIDAEAAALGFKKVDGAFENNAQQAATLSLIMKQTADAQGNFAKENDTLAGQQQRAAAGWKNITTSIGGLFLPTLTKVYGFINTSILPTIQSLINQLGDGGLAGIFPGLSGAVSNFWSGLTMGGDVRAEFDGQLSGFVAFGAGLRAAFDIVKPLFQQVGAVVADLAPTALEFLSAFSPIGLIFQALQPVLPQIVALLSSLAGVASGLLTSAMVQLTPLVQQLVTMLASNFVSMMPLVTSLFTLFQDLLVALVPVVMSLLAAILPLATTLLTQLAPIFTELTTAVLPPLISIIGNIVAAIAPLVTTIAGLLIPIIQALMPIIVTVFGVIVDIISAAMLVVQGIIEVVTGIISGNWAQVWSGILNIIGGVFQLIINVISGAIQLVMSVVLNGLNALVGFFTSAFTGIVNYVVTSWTSIITGAQGMLADLLGFFGGIGDAVLGALGNIGGLLLESGKALIQGFIDGIMGMAGAIGDAVGGVLEGVRDFFPFSPAKRGPFSGSGYTSHSGKALAGDFAKGMVSEEAKVQAAANTIMTAATLTGSTAVGGGQAATAGAVGAKPGTVVHVSMPIRDHMSPEGVARAFDNQLNYKLRTVNA
ncbi:hypothetical protein [Paenarthrobacter sp. YJN-5]|uniref:phage tail protein n=2 Tax=Paenarthrobacter TaxID=1742992 RepID=UPI001878C4A4|nr:hypothetical protein [Paenarthrobacter sp. YJN-5]QOT16478.1 hypothetical protein HMI59_07580 [Paenarthrobacter sp. YJN-5]